MKSAFAKVILFNICVVSFCLAGGEIACRELFPDFSAMQKGHFRKDFAIDPFLTAGVFQLDEHTFWRIAHNDVFGTNRQGFRDNQASTVLKKPGTFRIICIGDSVTFGVPADQNSPEETFAKKLETLLLHHFGENTIEVLNAGVPGYTSYQGLLQLKHRLLRYHPDLVIVQFGINDGSPAIEFADNKQIMPSGHMLSVRNWLGKSALVFAIAHIVKKTNIHQYSLDGQNIVRVMPDDFRNNLTQMKNIGRTNGFQLLFIAPVRYLENNLSKVELYQPPKDAMVVDMFHAFQHFTPDLPSLFHDDCHLTPKGHMLLAQTIYKTILQNHLVK
jgi:lysophospholipase L1-like esterase